jgi:hypothetical protein
VRCEEVQQVSHEPVDQRGAVAEALPHLLEGARGEVEHGHLPIAAVEEIVH